jgi:hypothetical protein
MVYNLLHISVIAPLCCSGCIFCVCVSASSTAKPYLCLDSSPNSTVTKGEESPNHPNGIEEQAPEPLPQSNMVLRKRIRKIKQGMKRCAIALILGL